LIVNKLLSLSLSYRPSVIYLIVKKLLSLSPPPLSGSLCVHTILLGGPATRNTLNSWFL
jgi:hypothetical protein